MLPFIVVAWLKRTGMWWIEELVKVIVGMIVFSELYSIIGHIYSINYGKELGELDAFKMLLERLEKFIKGLINKQNLDSKDEEEWKKNDNTESQEQI